MNKHFVSIGNIFKVISALLIISAVLGVVGYVIMTLFGKDLSFSAKFPRLIGVMLDNFVLLVLVQAAVGILLFVASNKSLSQCSWARNVLWIFSCLAVFLIVGFASWFSLWCIPILLKKNALLPQVISALGIGTWTIPFILVLRWFREGNDVK